MQKLGQMKNKYGNHDKRLTEARDGVTFSTIEDDKMKGNKKKKLTCYK